MLKSIAKLLTNRFIHYNFAEKSNNYAIIFALLKQNPFKVLMFYNDQNSNQKQTTMVIMNIDDLREAFKAWNQEQIEANTPQEEIYITAKEAARMLGVTLSTLWRWDNDKYLEKIKIGNKVRYRLSDVERMIKGAL